VFEKLQDFPDNVAAYVCHGHLTKADFAGVDPGARWDQTKFGFDHLFDFERVAFVSDVTWMNRAVQVFAFFIIAAIALSKRVQAPPKGIKDRGARATD
jgi:hypothetical protein